MFLPPEHKERNLSPFRPSSPPTTSKPLTHPPRRTNDSHHVLWVRIHSLWTLVSHLLREHRTQCSARHSHGLQVYTFSDEFRTLTLS